MAAPFVSIVPREQYRDQTCKSDRAWGAPPKGSTLCKVTQDGDDPQPSTLDLRPSTLEPQPSTLDPQPSTLNPQPSTLDPQPSTLDPQLSTLNPQPSTLNSQPSPLNAKTQASPLRWAMSSIMKQEIKDSTWVCSRWKREHLQKIKHFCLNVKARPCLSYMFHVRSTMYMGCTSTPFQCIRNDPALNLPYVIGANTPFSIYV